MIVHPCDAPQEALDTGIFGGHWYRAEGSSVKAVFFWRGGPGTPDKDIFLFSMDATFPGGGAGTTLLLELLAWADERKLNIGTVVSEQRHADWLQRAGFVPARRYMDDIEMVRPTGRKGVAHTLVAPESANPFK